MKQLAFLFTLLTLALSSVGVSAQPVSSLPDDLKAYRDNSFQQEIFVDKADSAQVTTARLIDYLTQRPLPVQQQPKVTRSGLKAIIYWSVTNGLPERSILEILAGPSVRYRATFRVNKDPTFMSRPGTLTVVSPISRTVTSVTTVVPEPVTAKSIWKQLLDLLIN